MLYNEKLPYIVRHSVPLGYVEIIWNGYLTTEQLNSGFAELLEVLEEKQAKLLLVDASNISNLGPGEQAWIRDHFLPVLQKNKSIEKMARIIDPDVFVHAVVSNMIHLSQARVPFTFTMNSFSDRGEALEWLLKEVPV